MKKILIILITCLVLTGCTIPRRNTIYKNNINKSINQKNGEIEMSFGTYNIPSTWTKRDDHSTASKYFFANKNDNNNPPNNISVEMGTNYYSSEDHIKFREAILMQMGNQAKAYGMTLTSSGTTSSNGYVVYTFTMKGNTQTTTQHYIVGDYKYVLVHETIFNGDTKDTDSAAKTIVNSFKWKN